MDPACPHASLALHFIALQPFLVCGACGPLGPVVPEDPNDVAFA